MTGILDLPDADILIYLSETYSIEEDFERWNATGWTESENGSGTVTVPSSAAAKRQNYGMRSDIPASAGRHSGMIYKTFTNTSNDPVYVNFWFRINSTTLSADDFQIAFWCSSGLSVIGFLEVIESGGDLYLNIVDYDGTSYSGSASPLTVGTWYHVVAGLKNHTSAGVVYLKLNDTVLVNETPTMADDLTIASVFFGIDKLYMTGNYAAQADFDEVYVALSNVSVNVTPDPEAILNIHLHLGCTNEVSSFEIILDRGNPTYDQEIDPGEANALSTGLECDIYLGRGTNKPLLLSGQIDEIEYVDEIVDFSFRNICIIRGRCNGYQLFGKHYDGDLISDVGTGYRNYKRASGDASSIVAYIIDIFTDLSHVRVSDAIASTAASGQKVVAVTDGTKFTAGQLVKIEDDNAWEYNKIASIATNNLTMTSNLLYTYTVPGYNAKVWIDLIEDTSTTFTELQYIDTVPFDIIKYIAEVSDLSGTIGYDTRVEYDGKFAFFSKGSKSESYSLQDECQVNRYLKDANRIKNKITVKGKADMPYPLGTDGEPYSDVWTEKATPMIFTALTQNAASGQTDIKVAEGASSVFSADDYVYIKDKNAPTNFGELAQIDSITLSGGNDDTITMKENLNNAYTTANFAIVWLVSVDTRWGWDPLTAVDDFTISSEGTIKIAGSYSVKVIGNNAREYYTIMMPLLPTEHFNANEYLKLKLDAYFGTTAPSRINIYLFSGDLTGSGDYAFYLNSKTVDSGDIDGWKEYEWEIGTKNASKWQEFNSFSWTDISMIYISFVYSSGTYTLYMDKLYAVGKRWGGGTDDATVDGYAENTSSQTTYGIRELVIISDLLLSNAQCESKAQALIDYYSDERLVIEASSENLDWTTYHPMAGNKVAADLDLLGVTGSTYRIDSIDIVFRGSDNSLSVGFTLDNTPMKLADYLYKISEKLKQLDRNYSTIR